MHAGDFQQTNAALAVCLAETWRAHKAGQAFQAGFELSPSVLAGLAACQWPGRSQTLPLSSNLCLYLDGAHTPLSTACCAQWYDACASNYGTADPVGEVSAQQLTSRTKKRALVFYCSHERDVVSVLRPLVQTGNFDTAVFCPLLFSRPSKLQQDSAASILEAAGVAPTQIFEPAATWEGTLCQVWEGLCAEHFGAGHGRHSAVAESVALVLDQLRDQAAGEPGTDCCVLVTGSLYLVGNVLEALDWCTV